MRILHITARADCGGGPENIRRLIAHRVSNIEHHVACPNERPYWDRYIDLIGPGRIVELPHRRFNPFALLRVARFCRANKIQLIHSHGFGAGLYGRPLGRLLSIPSLHTFHGFHLNREGLWSGPIKLAIERLLRPLTTHYVSVSRSESLSVVSALKLRPSVISIIANGVDTSVFAQAERSTSSRFVIIAAGRLSAEKNPLALVHIIHRLRCLYPDSSAVLHVAGDGPLRSRMDEEISRLSLGSHVRMLGWIDDVGPLMRDSEVYLSASFGEGLSLGMLEALASGLPVIASEVQGHTDVVIPGSTGFLFEINAIDAAAHFLHGLETDTFLRAGLSEGARHLAVNEFSLSRCVSLHEELFARFNPSAFEAPAQH